MEAAPKVVVDEDAGFGKPPFVEGPGMFWAAAVGAVGRDSCWHTTAAIEQALEQKSWKKVAVPFESLRTFGWPSLSLHGIRRLKQAGFEHFCC
jgi:hypothetical protein